MLSGRGLCDGPIARPGAILTVGHFVWCWNLKNTAAVARVGLLRWGGGGQEVVVVVVLVVVWFYTLSVCSWKCVFSWRRKQSFFRNVVGACFVLIDDRKSPDTYQQCFACYTTVRRLHGAVKQTAEVLSMWRAPPPQKGISPVPLYTHASCCSITQSSLWHADFWSSLQAGNGGYFRLWY